MTQPSIKLIFGPYYTVFNATVSVWSVWGRGCARKGLKCQENAQFLPKNQRQNTKLLVMF